MTTLDRLRSRMPPALQSELDFELDLFVSRLELLETRSALAETGDSTAGPPGDPARSRPAGTIDAARIRGDLYDFLKDDLVYFLQKIHSGHYERPAGFPT
ncbi:MAG: hypothetical protein RIF32_17300, partial [Leptospirales bacterium]